MTNVMERLSADTPIRSRAEDALGYRSFADALAKGLILRAPKEGFIVGIQAHWGMGKTSAINLLLEAIEDIEAAESERQHTKTGTYNAWRHTNLGGAANGYLSLLGRLIEETLPPSAPRTTRLLVERLIKSGGEFLGHSALGDAFAPGDGVAPQKPTASRAAPRHAQPSAHAASHDTSLDVLLDELGMHLETLDCRLLVVVDDLDRLQPAELRQLLTSIKTFGSLPNVTHVLAYDRELVESALAAAQPGAFRDPELPTFLEKIVQAEFDLPYPTEANLDKFVREKFEAVFGHGAEMEVDDWMLLREVMLRHYLRSPRDIFRLCNSLSIVWPVVKGEVYIPDLIAVELLRYHDHAAYHLIRLMKDFLLGRAPGGRQRRTATRQRLLEAIPEGRRGDVAELLTRMFPALASANIMRPQSYQSGQLLAGRRIGDPNGFDSYFRFDTPAHEISVVEFREVMDNLNDEGFLVRFIENALARKRPDGTSFVGTFLEHLPELLESVDQIGPQLLIAVLKTGDRIIEMRDEVTEFYVMNNERRLGPVVTKLLRKTGRQATKKAIEAVIDDAAAGVGAVAYAVAYLGSYYGLVLHKRERGTSPVLSREEVVDVGNRLCAKIANLGGTGRLQIASTLDVMLRVWITFGQKRQARAWLESRFGDPEAFATIAFSQMRQVDSVLPPYRYREVRGDIDQELFDVRALLRFAKQHQASGALAEADRSDLGRFAARLESRMQAPRA